MNNKYFSFLICAHEKVTNIYYNGVHVGDIINFSEFKFKKENFTINDLIAPKDNFDNLTRLAEVIDDMIALFRYAAIKRDDEILKEQEEKNKNVETNRNS